MKNITTLSLLTVLLFGCAVRGAKNQNSSQSFGGSFGNGQSIQYPSTQPTNPEQISLEQQATPPVQVILSEPTGPGKAAKLLKKNTRKIEALSWNRAAPQDSSKASNKDLPIEKNAKIGFWLAIGGIVTSFIPYVQFLSFFALIAALILGIVGRKKINENPGKFRGYGMATAAIVIPIIFFVLALLVILILIAVLASGF
jgi:hypothetical protein